MTSGGHASSCALRSATGRSVSEGTSRSTIELAPYAALAGLAIVLWLVLVPPGLPALRAVRTMAEA